MGGVGFFLDGGFGFGCVFLVLEEVVEGEGGNL